MELTVENIETKLREMCEAWLPETVTLTPYGLVLKSQVELYHNDISHFFSEHSVKTMNKIIKEIPRLFQKHSPIGKKYWNTSSSYGSKHFLEHNTTDPEYGTRGIYSYNGQFIFAMLLLGYEMKPHDLKTNRRMSFRNRHTGKMDVLEIISPNPTFNCSYRDLTKVVCECGLQYRKTSKTQHMRSRSHQMIVEAKHLGDTDTEFGEYINEVIERLV
jgi:hypothetical protein